MDSAPAQSERCFDRFIGVDLGGGQGKNTAVALLERAGDCARVAFVGTKSAAGTPFHDAQLLEYVEQQRETALLAIGAPLTLPACVRCRLPRCAGVSQCTDQTISWFRSRERDLLAGEEARQGAKPPVTPYTQRACEVLLRQQYGIPPRETLGQGMGPLAARAHYLRRALEPHFTLNHNMIEVYPKATLTMLFDAERAQAYKRQVNTWRTRAAMLEALDPDLRFDVWREGCLRNDHCFDAVICAFTGYLWATEGWTLPHEHRDLLEQDGWIWFPPA